MNAGLMSAALMKAAPMSAAIGLMTLLVLSPAWGQQSEEEASLTQPLLAIGAFGLGAVDAACLAPSLLTIGHVAGAEPAPEGPVIVSYVCGAVQISGGLAYALRDGPSWQRTMGVITVSAGVFSLTAAILGTWDPLVAVAGLDLRVAPWADGHAAGLSVDLR